MMKKWMFLTLVLSFSMQPVLAVDYESLMRSGNAAYEAGEYPKAIMEYEKILLANYSSADLFYNLGCAYFNEQIYGQAILNFEKARQLQPRDADILHNLEYTKLFLKDRFELPEPMPFIAWFTNIRSGLSIKELKRMEMLTFGLFVLSFLAYRLTRRHRFSSWILFIVLGSSLIFIASSGWLLDRLNALDKQHAVLLVETSNVKSAPISGSNTLFVIHEGTNGEILDATEAWYKIRLPDGKTGWVQNEIMGIY